MHRIQSLIFSVLIVISACILIVTASWNESLTFDEVTYIPSGYSYLTRADMRINPEHPPLFKDIAALPLLFMDIHQDAFSTPSWNDNSNDQWEFGKQFLFKSGNDANAIAHAARLPMLFFFILTAGVIFIWTRSRFGNTAAYMALVVFCFSPSIMAHAGFVTNDVASACGALVGLFAFAYFLRQPTYIRAFIAGLGLGFALLTKFSNVLLIPLFLGFALCYTYFSSNAERSSLTLRLSALLKISIKIGTICAVAIIVCVYPLYALHVSHYPAEKQRLDTHAITNGFSLTGPLVWLSDKPVVRPFAHFILGVSMNVIRTGGVSKSYLAGEISNDAPTLYFPIAYLIKEPLPWILLTILGLSAGIFGFFKQVTMKRRSDKDAFFTTYQDELLMVSWIFAYGGLSIAGNLAIGIRHIFPLYPFIIMLVCGMIVWAISYMAKRHATYSRIAHVGVWLLIIWYVVENLIAFPFYLPYFNQLVGGSKNGGAYLNDSNVDWGQELIRLRAWLDENNVTRIEGDIFTSTYIEYYLGNRFIPLWHNKYSSAEDFMTHSETEWIAISESTLRAGWALGRYTWLQAHEPVTTIGHAMRVYRITD